MELFTNPLAQIQPSRSRVSPENATVAHELGATEPELKGIAPRESEMSCSRLKLTVRYDGSVGVLPVRLSSQARRLCHYWHQKGAAPACF